MGDAPTLRDVAAAAGVSLATASVAMADHATKPIAKATRDAVRATARQIGYRRHRAAPGRGNGRAGDPPIGYAAVSRAGGLRVSKLHADQCEAIRDATARNRSPVGPCDWVACALVPAGRGGER